VHFLNQLDFFLNFSKLSITYKLTNKIYQKGGTIFEKINGSYHGSNFFVIFYRCESKINLLVSCSDLVKRLEKNRYSKPEITKFLTDSRIDINRKMLDPPVGPGLFDPRSKVFRQEYFERSKGIVAHFKPFWDKLENRYGVEREALVSHFRMESDLGNYCGKHNVVNILLSMIHYNYKTTYKDSKTGKLKVREWKPWAIKQSIHFLKACRDNGLDPHEIIGSYRAAFGFWQFIPSSFTYYAVDGNGDGKKDPFNFMTRR